MIHQIGFDMTKPIKFFMIQHKETKQWSKGGVSYATKFHGRDTHWTDKKRFGKIWRGTGPLKNHLNQFSPKCIEQWEIIEIQLDMED